MGTQCNCNMFNQPVIFAIAVADVNKDQTRKIISVRKALLEIYPTR